MELLSENALISPGGHAYLYMKRGDDADKPVLDSVADIRLRVFDLSNQLVNEDETQVILKTAQPLIKDIVRQMVVGDKVRVWGESYLRVWEVELLGFQTPKPGELLATGPQKPEDNAKPWIITKRVKNERLQKDQMVHVQIIRWKDKGEQGLQFDTSYDLLVQVNKRVLAKYYDLFLDMGVGERARAWHLNSWDPKDAVYDIRIIDRYPQYETPEMFEPSEPGVTRPAYGVYKKLLYRPPKAKPIVEGPYKSNPFEISMNCWNETTGELIATSDLTTFGWSQGVTTTFRLTSGLELWCDLVDFEDEKFPEYRDDWQPNRCLLKPDYDAYQAEYDNKKANRPADIVKRRHRGHVYHRSDLSEHWRKVIDDAAFGDVFMVWISSSITNEAAKRRDPDEYESFRNTVCRVKIDERVPDRDELK